MPWYAEFVATAPPECRSAELPMDSVGIDISEFNCQISNAKVRKYNISDVQLEIKRISDVLNNYLKSNNVGIFEETLISRLNEFNSEYFPSPDYRYKVLNGIINENEYSEDKVNNFKA